MDWLHMQTGINIFLQNLGGWLLIPMQLFSFLGTEEFFMAFIPLLFWSVDILLGIRVSLILLLNDGINQTLKVAFHTPRPFWIDPKVKALSTETSFGLPSGHSQTASGLWSMAGIYIKKKWAIAIALTLIFFIGLSRIYLGVHFLTDVLLGWLLGCLVLWLYLKSEPHLIAWLKAMNFQKRVTWSFISTGIILIVLLIPHWLMANWQIPNEWLVNARPYLSAGTQLDPLNTDGIFTSIGTWLGMTLGIAWMFSRHNGYVIKGSFMQKALRYLVGLAGVLILRFGLKLIFPGGENLIADIFRVIRYTVIGLWISVWAPLVFIRIGLTERTKK